MCRCSRAALLRLFRRFTCMALVGTVLAAAAVPAASALAAPDPGADLLRTMAPAVVITPTSTVVDDALSSIGVTVRMYSVGTSVGYVASGQQKLIGAVVDESSINDLTALMHVAYAQALQPTAVTSPQAVNVPSGVVRTLRALSSGVQIPTQARPRDMGGTPAICGAGATVIGAVNGVAGGLFYTGGSLLDGLGLGLGATFTTVAGPISTGISAGLGFAYLVECIGGRPTSGIDAGIDDSHSACENSRQCYFRYYHTDPRNIVRSAGIIYQWTSTNGSP